MHNGVRVAMREPAPVRQVAPQFTASGSVETSESRARVARASRIWVEGVHDAELLEKIWGDDLRHAAVVVEPLHGADDLAAAVAGFRPGTTRRLGVLLDHLVEGSKESRIAQEVRHPDVLICGHPYVDIWAAIKQPLQQLTTTSIGNLEPAYVPRICRSSAVCVGWELTMCRLLAQRCWRTQRPAEQPDTAHGGPHGRHRSRSGVAAFRLLRTRTHRLCRLPRG